MRFLLVLHQSRLLLIPVTAFWLFFLLGWLITRSDGTGGRPLVILWGASPSDYDPHRTSHPIAQAIFRHVCEPLFYEDDDGTVRGLLAEDEVLYSDGGRRLTIRLRPNITFHDGTALDAAAVQASFSRLQQLALSPLATSLRDVTVAAQPDPFGRTVLFTLPEADYDFVRLVLSHSYAVIVSPQAQSALIACTGPYRFAPSLYEPDKSLTLVRFPTYHWPATFFANQGAAHIPQLKFIFEADRRARLEALLSGDACVLSLSKEQVTQVKGVPHLRLYEATGGLTYLGANEQRSRWQDVRVRQAVAQALDKAALAKLGPFQIAKTPLIPDAIGYDSRVASGGYQYEPKRSRTLLARANFDRAAEVILLIPESNTYRELATVVEEQLEAIGLKIRRRELPREDILTQRQDFDLLLFDYAWGDYTALSIFLGPGPRNLLNYAGGDVAELVQQARTTAEREQRQELIRDAQQIVLEQALWQPLLVRQITFAVDTRCVQGTQQAITGELLFHDAETH